MENVNKAEELKNHIDSAIEAKANEVSQKSSEAIEEVKSEVTETIESVKAEAKETAEMLQKEIDNVKQEIKVATPKEVKMENGLQAWLKENATEVFNNKGANAIYEVKNESTYSPSAGVASAPYADDRQTEIEFDPHQMTLAKYIMAKTGTGGAYRLSTRTNETDNSGPKAKGAAFGRTELSVSDQHNPYITVGHILTVPKEELNDTIALESYFREDMTGYLTDTINSQILTGTGGTANIRGIATISAPRTEAQFDTFFGGLNGTIDGANQIDVLNAVQASLKRLNFMGKKYVFVNPELIAAIQGVKATDGHYQLNSAVDPTGKVRNYLGGIELIENSAVAAGSFYAFDESALKWVTREGMKMEMGYTGDDWERNNVSLKVYGRFALVSGLPAGIVVGTFANAQASLETP